MKSKLKKDIKPCPFCGSKAIKREAPLGTPDLKNNLSASNVENF